MNRYPNKLVPDVFAMRTWPAFPDEDNAAAFAIDHPCGWAVEVDQRLRGCGKLLEPIWLRGRDWAVPLLCCPCAGCTHPHEPPPEDA